MDRSIAAAMCSKNKKQGGVNSMMGMMPEAVAAMRKGPWTEEEDAQLVWFVRLFGERRWDFLAKVSGLKRTGKSCRLRWVNYLHPGLRRGRITADEERLILDLYARWGSRWSRIARSLPGRTDNEIKNFWRTRTRKHRAAALGGDMPQRKDDIKTSAATSASSSSPATSGLFGSPNSGTATSSSTVTESSALRESGGGGDGADLDEASTSAGSLQQHHQQPQQEYCYTMDQLWNEIPAASCYDDMVSSWGAALAEPAMPSSPVWELSSDFSLWKIDDEEYYKKMLHAS